MDILVLLAIALVILAIIYSSTRTFLKNWRTLKKLPQTKGHILLGNIELFTGKLFVKHTTLFYERVFNGFNALMTEELRGSDVFLFWLTFVPYVLFTNAKSVEQLLTSNKLIEKSTDYNFLKPWLSTGLLTSGSDKWRSRRKFLTPTFHFRILNDFVPIINKHSLTLVDKLKEKVNQSLDIVEYMQMETLDVICETAMGVCIDAQKGPGSKYAAAVISASDAMFTRLFAVQHWNDFIYYKSKNGREFKKTIDFLHNFTYDVIKSRKKAMLEEMTNSEHEHGKPAVEKEEESIYFGKKKKSIAFMDLLIKRHLEGLKPDGSSDFTPADIREEVDTFMFEGFDTTSAALTFTLHLLGHNPEIQEKAYEELHAIFGGDTERHVTEADLHNMKYIELCIKEGLRLYPSVPLIGREITEDVDICGRTIPKNTMAVVYVYGLHRDPKVYPDPDKFVPERFLPENCLNRHPFAYIPFSAGPRNCIGQKFAMMELKITIANVLRNFKVQSMNSNISISVDIITKAKEAVLIKFTPRT